MNSRSKQQQQAAATVTAAKVTPVTNTASLMIASVAVFVKQVLNSSQVFDFLHAYIESYCSSKLDCCCTAVGSCELHLLVQAVCGCSPYPPEF